MQRTYECHFAGTTKFHVIGFKPARTARFRNELEDYMSEEYADDT